MEEKLKVLAAKVTDKLNDGLRAKADMFRKNNGYFQPGIKIIKEGSPLMPCMYVDPDLLSSDMDLDVEAEKMARFVLNKGFQEMAEEANVNVDTFLTREGLLNSVIPCLIGYEKNREILDNIPHRRFLDMAIVFRGAILSENKTKCTGSILINNAVMNAANITLEELEEAATKNVEDVYIIREMFELRIATSKYYCHGAAAVLRTKLLDRLAEVEADGGRIWLIPSSVHEMIAFDADLVPEDKVLSFVKNVNGNKEIMEEEDILTDSVYIYDPAEKELRIAISGEG